MPPTLSPALIQAPSTPTGPASPAGALKAWDAPGSPRSTTKAELLAWVNKLLALQLTKVEQCASGAVFCQLVDAHYADTIPIQKVNFFAKDEYESTQNYKVLQTGFNLLKITREMHIVKLSRGALGECLDLLTFLHRHLSKVQPLPGYDPRKERAFSVKGGTDAIPAPKSNHFDHYAGKNNFGWTYEADAQGESLKSQLGVTGGRPRSARPTSAAPSTTTKRPAVPVRNTTLPKNKKQEAKGSKANSASGVEEKESSLSKSSSSSGRTHRRTISAVRQEQLQELQQQEQQQQQQRQRREQQEEEALGGVVRDDCDEEGITRLVVPDDAFSTDNRRPLTPGGASLLRVAADAGAQALSVLRQAAVSMAAIGPTLGSTTDCFAYRGKVTSLGDAAVTLRGHLGVLLGDACVVAARGGGGEAAQMLQRQQEELPMVDWELNKQSKQLATAVAAAPVAPAGALNLQLTQLQKQLASTAALDGALREVVSAHAALTQRMLRESATVASQFLAADATTSGSASRVLRVGDWQLKSLRNGDVYKGSYVRTHKSGDGTYCFTNGDVYEGEFGDDRMQGVGVYSFSPEGRFAGEWAGAVYEGAGTESFAKGSNYRGEYSGGSRCGWGSCRFHNGDYYEGQWSKGLRDGRGMQQCTDDSNYVGQYAAGKRSGYGVYSFPNGDQYLGEYAQDMPHGYGVYVFGSGQRYEGCWEAGKKHGWSLYTVETGQRWAGSWMEGKPQWVHPLEDAELAAAAAANGAAAPTAADGAAGADAQDNLAHAWRACKLAQEACQIALSKAAEHWAPDGDVQRALAAASSCAMGASEAAQAARLRAGQVAAKLEMAALLVEASSKAADIKLVEQPKP